MDKLLIIADDFTGALDTGIQFTKMGIPAKIITDYQHDFSKSGEDYPLFVVNTDSRPLSLEDAYQRVYDLSVRARAAGFQYVYKKTDSGMRGNIGSELKAVMDAYEVSTAYFSPALPSQKRITRDGIQYIDGVKVEESVFGQDPFEPVRHSDVADIIHLQFDAAVHKVPVQALPAADLRNRSGEKTVMVFDAETDEDLYRIADSLKAKTDYQVCAGCAGFAVTYQRLLEFETGETQKQQKTNGLLALCGSVNAITVGQLDYAEAHGFARRNLGNRQKLDPAYLSSEEGKAFLDQLYEEVAESHKYLLDTLDQPEKETVAEYASANQLSSADIRVRIADTLGRVAAEMVERGYRDTISMTGGDTLMGFMRYTGTTELVPIGEIGKGAVLSQMDWNGTKIQVISKSGGFGEANIFLEMYNTVAGQ